MSEEAPRKPRDSGVAYRLITWIRDQQPGRLFSLDEATAAVGAQRSAVASSLNRMLDRYPELTRKGRGIYVWSPVVAAAPPPAPAPSSGLRPVDRPTAAKKGATTEIDITLTVVSVSGDDRLVRDRGGNLFTLKPFKF
jgi:hypothetical protein